MLPRTLPVIEARTFYNCKHLRSVTVGAGPESDSNVAAFIAPPHLQRIGSLAFAGCTALKEFRVNEDIRELGWLCLWNSGVAKIDIPPHVRMTPEQLGIG